MEGIVSFIKKHVLSLILIVAYIFTLNAMTKFHIRGVIEGGILTIPAILFIMAWSSFTLKNYSFRSIPESSSNESNADLFLIFYSLFLSTLIHMCLEKNNTDLSGWWPFVLLFMSVIYFIFSFIFTWCLQTIPKHKHYTQIWFLIILFSFPILHYLPFRTNIWLVGSFETFYVLLMSYLSINVLMIFILRKLRLKWKN